MLGWDDLAAERSRTINFLIKRTCISRDDAEDFTGEAILRAYQARDRFDGANIKAWLMFIAINLVRSAKRHEKLGRVMLTLTGDLPDRASGDNPEAALIAKEGLALLGSVPPTQRDAVIRAALGDSYEEIGAFFNIEVGTAKSRVSRARSLLHQMA